MSYVLTIILSGTLLVTGAMKMVLPKQRLVEALAWVSSVPAPVLPLWGGFQLAAGMGIIIDRLISPDVLPGYVMTGASYALPLLGGMMALAVLVHLLNGDPLRYALPSFTVLMLLVLLTVGF